MKGLNFALRFTQLNGRGEGFTDRFSVYFAREAEVRAVARLVWLMTMTLRFTAASADGCDRTAAKITHIDDAGQNGTALLFERNKRLWQMAPPFLTYQYVRNIATKKSTADPSTFMSHTPSFPPHIFGGVTVRYWGFRPRNRPGPHAAFYTS